MRIVKRDRRVRPNFARQAGPMVENRAVPFHLPGAGVKMAVPKTTLAKVGKADVLSPRD